MPVIQVGTLIDHKPLSLTTSRNISFIGRIDAHLVKSQNQPLQGNITGLNQAVLVVPIGTDIQMGDTIYYGDILYEVNAKISEANLGGVEQYSLIHRE